jgi:hypothetical protein
MSQLNIEVTKFLDKQNHPLRLEIELLRNTILNSNPDLIENIKWNAPNYSFFQMDRITLRIQPPTQLQLIFHRGSKVQEQPPTKQIEDTSGLLIWKTNDRAVATFKNTSDIEKNKSHLMQWVKDWINHDVKKPLQ